MRNCVGVWKSAAKVKLCGEGQSLSFSSIPTSSSLLSSSIITTRYLNNTIPKANSAHSLLSDAAMIVQADFGVRIHRLLHVPPIKVLKSRSTYIPPRPPRGVTSVIEYPQSKASLANSCASQQHVRLANTRNETRSRTRGSESTTNAPII